MDTLKNALLIDARDNPELKDLISTWEVGKKVTITIEAQVNDIVSGGDSATLSLESIEPKGYENPDPKEGESESEIKPKSDAPVLMALGQRLNESGD